MNERRRGGGDDGRRAVLTILRLRAGQEEVAHKRGLVVRRRVEGDERHAPHVDARILESGEELAETVLEMSVDRLRLIGDGELDGGDDCAARQRRVALEIALQLGHELLRVEERELAEAFGDHVARALLDALAVLDEREPDGLDEGLDGGEAGEAAVHALVADHLLERVEEQVLTLRVALDLVEYERYVLGQVAQAQIAERVRRRRLDLLDGRRERVQYDQLQVGVLTQLTSINQSHTHTNTHIHTH